MFEELADMIKNENTRGIVQIMTFFLVMACGIVGTLGKYQLDDMLGKMAIIETRTETLTTTAAEAKTLAAEAKTATESARAESNGRFDTLEKALQNESLAQTKTELKIYSLSIRIGCLERRVVCPQPTEP